VLHFARQNANPWRYAQLPKAMVAKMHFCYNRAKHAWRSAQLIFDRIVLRTMAAGHGAYGTIFASQSMRPSDDGP
jgi:hypothetical protein